MVIPNSVTKIGTYAFHSCSGLTSITIPDSVTEIGNKAFYGCSGLTTAYVPSSTYVYSGAFPSTTRVIKVGKNGALTEYTGPGGDMTIPDSVTSIGDRAFSGCTGLTSVTIPNSVTEIGYRAFSGCTGLTSVTIPDSVTSIGDSAFSGCTGLTSVTIPDSVTSIDNSAFSGCTGLTSVTIPDSVTSIDNSAFSGCTGLTSVTIPDSVTEIGSSAFASCTGLTGVTLPNSITEISDNMFYNCTGLTSITIPESVTKIDSGAFSGCTGLKSVELSSSVQLDDNAFPSTTEVILKDQKFTIEDGVLKGYRGPGGQVTIPDGVTEIGISVDDSYVNSFFGSNVTGVTIPSSVTKINAGAFYNCAGLTDITIPESVTEIGSHAFSGCISLTSVTIPSSVTKIGNNAFSGCKNLKTVAVPSSAQVGYSAFPSTTKVTLVGDYFNVEDGVLTEYRGPGGQVTIPNGVTEIGGGYYYSAVFGSNVTGVTIPNSVTKIGGYAFKNCTGLTSITIPDSVKEIGGSAFSGCTGLTSVTIPESVTEIDNNAFSGCKNLKTAAVPSSTQVAYNAFPDTTQVTLVGNYFNVVNGVLQGYNGPGGHVTIPGSVTVIGDKAFSNCLVLTGVTIPGSVISIGYQAFSGCTGLTSVTIPDSVKEIGSNAFSGCLNLTTATVPTATAVGSDVFPSITTVTRTGHLFTVNNGVLSGYEGPGGAIAIPDGVTRIAERAFADRSDITSVTFPGSLTAIDSYAFYGCTGLKSVELLSSVQIGSNAFPSSTKVNQVGSYFDVQSGVLKKYVGPGGSIAIPDEVTSIAAGVFANRADITGVTVPGGVTEIGSQAFQGCTGLTGLELPGRLTKIGDSAFDRCTGLRNVTFPSGLTSIGSSAFSGCTGLTGAKLPGSLTTIDDSAFYGCAGLTSVTIPDGVTKIGQNAFCGCTGLTSITIPGSVTTLERNPFYGCDNLTSVSVGYGVKTLNLNIPSLKRITLPDSVEKLTIFSNALQELVIPAGVTGWPNLRCPMLNKLTFPKDNWVFKGISRADFMKQISYYPSLNEIVNCPNEFVEDLVTANRAIQTNWTNPKATLVTQSAQITQLANEITAGCATDYDKAKAISQWVVSHIKYDDDYYYEGLKDYSDVPFNAEEVLGKGRAVCAGYARLTQALLVAQNIPCLYVLGWTSGGYHAWNLAYVDGSYLWLDNTWGMDYFGLGIYAISKSHQATGAATFNGVKGPGTLVPGADAPINAETLSEIARETTSSTETIPATGTAYASTQMVSVDGKGVSFLCYALKDANGFDTNYIKLRDVAAILNGSAAQFQVGWEGSIFLTTKTAYTPNGTENKQNFTGNQNYSVNACPVLINGTVADFQAITLTDVNGGGYTYFKLRDLGQALGFNVSWSEAAGITVDTNSPYDASN